MAEPIPTPDSSRQQLLTCYATYLDYDLEASIARAKLFVKSARMLLRIPLTRTASAARGEEAEFDPTIVERELDKAVAWLRQRQAYENELPTQYTIDEDWRS